MITTNVLHLYNVPIIKQPTNNDYLQLSTFVEFWSAFVDLKTIIFMKYFIYSRIMVNCVVQIWFQVSKINVDQTFNKSSKLKKIISFWFNNIKMFFKCKIWVKCSKKCTFFEGLTSNFIESYIFFPFIKYLFSMKKYCPYIDRYFLIS